MPENPALQIFKPNIEETAQRWQAYYAGEIIDRPVVCVTAPREGRTLPRPITYQDKAFGDLDAVVEKELAIAEATFWGGEAAPSFYPSIGPDEIAVFCGAELRWSTDSPDTNWSLPCVEDWEKALPLHLDSEHPLWLRQRTPFMELASRYLVDMSRRQAALTH